MTAHEKLDAKSLSALLGVDVDEDLISFEALQLEKPDDRQWYSTRCTRHDETSVQIVVTMQNLQVYV